MIYDDLFNFGLGRASMGLMSDPYPSSITHDRYDVYINQDFIGQKYLLTAQESVHDIDEFLKNEGIKEFESYLDGDHYYIKAGENERRAAEVLKVYLQNR